MALVIAPECCCSTPRIIIQKCLASQITPTPKKLDDLLNRLRHLLRQPLLNLQGVARTCPPDAESYSGRSLSFAADMPRGFPKERQHVFLAKAEKLDDLHDYHSVVLYFVHCTIHQTMDIRAVAAGQKSQGLPHSIGRPNQPDALRILAEPSEKLPDQRRNRLLLKLRIDHSYGRL